MVAIRKTILFTGVFGLLLFGYGAGAQTLDEEIREVDRLRTGLDTPFDEVEKRCNELLKKYTKMEEQGKIYFELVQVEGQSGFQRPEKIINYFNEALDCPQEPLKKLRLYVYWGDAIQVAHRGVHNRELMVARRKAVIPYLKGLKESLHLEYRSHTHPELPNKVQDQVKESRDPMGPARQQIRTIQQKALEEWKRTQLEQRLNQYRDIFTGQISSMYSRFPWASDEIRELATKILKDEAAVERLMSAVDAAVKQRKRELGWEPQLLDITFLKELIQKNKVISKANQKDKLGKESIPKGKEIFIPKASIALTKKNPFVLDLASSKLINPAAKVYSRQTYDKLLKLGKGDIAWEGFLITVRKAEALTISSELHRPLKFTASKWTGSYTLANKVELPYTFIVRDKEKRNYLIRILKIQSDGIKINYKKLKVDEAKQYLPPEKKTK